MDAGSGKRPRSKRPARRGDQCGRLWRRWKTADRVFTVGTNLNDQSGAFPIEQENNLSIVEGRLAFATALADRAVALGKDHMYYRYFLADEALAEYRRGRFGSAIDWGRKAGEKGIWMPTHLVLAMAYQRIGYTEQARQSLDEAVKTYDWKNMSEESGIIRALRREAEALVNGDSRAEKPAAEKKPN